ncbi:MAG: ATP-binding cassette domain-containing protein [Lachnospiraceae bacterium]|nr:ATP-binding cassette domain-containing protein [Lachnospiraceae bacterium]
MNPIIKVENVSKTFHTKGGEVTALQDINLEIEKGDIYGIIGLSGAGKSTLVRCLNLLEKPTEGNVFVKDRNILELSPKELRLERRNIGMIFQHFNLLMQRNVLENICFPMEIAGVGKKEAEKKALSLLETVGMEEKAKAYPAQLSGGQKQRVAIARVLSNNPEILLCDEATSALDPQTTKSILELLKQINETLGITIVVITHEMSVIQEICNKVAVLETGHVVETGTVEELFRAPKTEQAKKLVYTGTPLVEIMKGEREIRITFEEESAFEPVIGNLILEFQTPVNILYANTKNINGKAAGEMILQLPEESDVADRMIGYFHSKNIKVEELTK